MLESMINIICAVASLIATIIIAVLQYKQSARMERLAIRQDAEEKKHREQYIKQQSDSFIIKYKNDNDDIYYLPLCWISSIYDSSLSYSREIYREYNMLEEDVQNEICKNMRLELSKPEKLGEDFYYLCVDRIKKEQYRFTRENRDYLFYEGAKYLHRCMQRYKNKSLPIDLHHLENRLTDLLLEQKENPGADIDAIKLFLVEFNFGAVDEIIACELCAVVAKWVAYWDACETELFWIPGCYGKEKIKTMEDLFLLALFCVYVFLMAPKEEEFDE